MEVESPSKLCCVDFPRTSTGVPLYIASKRVQLGVPFVDSKGHQEFQVPKYLEDGIGSLKKPL